MEQIQLLNHCIDTAPANSALKKHGRVEDPSSDMIECFISALDFLVESRQVGHTMADLAVLWKATETLIDKNNEHLGERVGTRDYKGDLIGWNIRKVHDMQHKVMITLC